MSKESRRRQRTTGLSTGTGPSSGSDPNAARGASGPSSSPSPAADHGAAESGGPTSNPGRSTPRRPSTGPVGTARVGRRERARSTVKPSFIGRYRTLLVGAAIVAIVAVVGAGLFAAATTPAFACSTIWQPEPTASPAQGASPQPGYVQPDSGHGHVATGTAITYTYCPPASGRHYNQSPVGPIPARPYGPGDSVIPPGWVHNLEHGGMVILYRGDQADQAALRATFDAIPVSPVCGFQPGGQSPGPVIARFDQMAWQYAAIVWGRVLPMEALDTAALLDFYARYGEKTSPEKLCEPSPSPSDPISSSPATSASAPAAPSASPSAAPSSAAAPSGSASPISAPSPS